MVRILIAIVAVIVGFFIGGTVNLGTGDRASRYVIRWQRFRGTVSEVQCGA